MDMKATIYDVAKLSGVSIATISRTFSDPEKVKSETRDKVYHAAEVLHYSPNAIARAMSRQRTENVAFLICKDGATILDEFYARVCDSVMNKTNQSTGRLLISTATDWIRGSGIQMRKQVEGAILGGDADQQLITDLKGQNVEIVQVNNRNEIFDLPCVISDERGGMKMLIDHLAGKGHKRIAFLAGRMSPYVTRERYKAYVDEMKAHGLEANNKQILMCEPTIQDATEAAYQILSNEERPTAMIGGNDVIAAGVFKAAKRLGISIPSELAVAGFDDSTICDLLEPELTSVHIDCAQMGALAVDMLGDILDGKKREKKVIVVPETLHIRAST